MDLFGIGNAVSCMLNIYRTSARRTGRTTMMLESLKDGDRIICARIEHKRDLEHKLRERGLKVEVRVIPPQSTHELRELGTPQGRTVFEHAWVEESYEDALKCHADYIDHYQQRLSGFGDAHRQTQRAAMMARAFDPRTPIAEVARLTRELGLDK
jgi:hypothetical protein